MTAVILILIIIGYVLIATRAWNHINKAAIAVFIGVAAWLLYILNGFQYAKSEHADELTSYFLSTAGDTFSIKEFISSHIFVNYITQACEVVLFLLATIGIAEVLNGNKCFNFVCDMIRSRKISFSLLIFRLLVVVKSISKCVVNEDHVDSVSVSGESGDQELTADGIHGFAVKAFACFSAWDI